MKQMKTLAYFASGTKFDFDKLNLIEFDQIILIDTNFKFNNSKVKKIGSKILLLKMEAMEAVDYLVREKVQLDCFVSLNEGLCEGGGYYPMNGFYFLSYLTPILKDTYFHVYDPSYYRFQGCYVLGTKKAFKNHWFIEVEKLKLSSIGLPVDSFTNLEKAICLKMVKKQKESLISKEFTSIEYIKGNIWENYDNLDLLILPYHRIYSHFISGKEKVMWFKNNSFPHVELEKLTLSENSVIGLVLWHGENYEMDFKLINEWALKNQVKVKLFFAHEEDKNKLENL